MATKSPPPNYINVLKSAPNGEVVVDHRTAPVGKPPRSYINIQFGDVPTTLDGELENGAPSNGHVGVLAPVSASVDIPGRGDSLKRHSSLNVSRQTAEHNTSSEDAVADAKLKLLLPDRSSKCQNCDELNRLLAMWEIGVSGLTRNYSRILAHLIKIRHSSMALEFRLQNPTNTAAATTVDPQAAVRQASLAPPSRIPKNRQSMFVSNNGANGFSASTSARDRDIAENMYPNRRAPSSDAATAAPEAPPPSSSYAADLKDLNSHLEGAIDLCQQLAAACFKTNHLSGSTSQTSLGHQISPSMRKHSAGESPSSNMYKPSLQSISEVRLTGGRKRQQGTLERVPSAPNLEQSGEMGSSGSQSDIEASFVTVRKDEVPDAVTKAGGVEQEPHDTAKGEEPVLGAEETLSENPTDEKVNPSVQDADGVGSFSEMGMPILSDHTPYPEFLRPAKYRPQSVISTASTYSDTDVKCVMSKIASLEEDRYKLLETINALQEDNSKVRSSLQEILGDLENKDLQLMLAMQDLTIATSVIQRAAEMRRRLDALSSERDLLMEKLGDLEDESAAVKVSLIQLLQEKSATNKTLALENFRLSQRVRQTSSRQGSKSSTGDSPGDNVSIHSAYSATVEDTTLHEAYMGADMSENFVHKQGFLVKQGGKVKNWKKRLFVLSSQGLSYYKTEQPIQTVPIDSIEKVVICHRTCPQKHMFELHTQGRTFFLSAPSADEMQSWVGMLETLKQFRKTATLHREANLRASALRKDHEDSAEDHPAQDHPPQEHPPHEHPPEEHSIFFSSPERDSVSPVLGVKTSDEDDEEDDEHVVLHQGGSAVPRPGEGATAMHLDDDDTAYLNRLVSGSVPSQMSQSGGAGLSSMEDEKQPGFHNM